ncbi:MAG: hypothetical protein AB2705_06450 [Candidatus Thiodiazotropha sp.]
MIQPIGSRGNALGRPLTCQSARALSASSGIGKPRPGLSAMMRCWFRIRQGIAGDD